MYHTCMILKSEDIKRAVEFAHRALLEKKIGGAAVASNDPSSFGM